MYNWPLKFDDLIFNQHGNECKLRFWKCFFRDFYFQQYIQLKDEQYGSFLASSNFFIMVGSKLAPVDDFGKPILKFARELAHIERLYAIISHLIQYKAYKHYDWNSIVIEAENKLNSWIQERDKKYQDADTALPHIVKSPRQWVEEVEYLPNPKQLWLDFWYQNEIACLFGDANLGKSIYAVQIANHIAASHRTLYIDYEMDAAAFLQRYTNSNGHVFKFSPNFFRAQVNPNAPVSKSFLKNVFSHIEDLIKKDKFEVVIIDNFTFITAGDASGEMTANFIFKLKLLKAKYNASFLIIAHSSKKDPSVPLSADHIMANRRLFHFLDSIFAIGKSASNKADLYIKQIKCRNRPLYNDENKVILARIVKVDSFLQLDTVGYDKETNMLFSSISAKNEYLARLVEKYRKDNLSFSQIADKLGFSKAKAIRLFKTINPEISSPKQNSTTDTNSSKGS